jgi:hypothetical protein
LLTWQLPLTEQSNDNERAEESMEKRTELADKSLITAVKIVSEMRRAKEVKEYFKKTNLMKAFNFKVEQQPMLTIGIH